MKSIRKISASVGVIIICFVVFILFIGYLSHYIPGYINMYLRQIGIDWDVIESAGLFNGMVDVFFYGLLITAVFAIILTFILVRRSRKGRKFFRSSADSVTRRSFLNVILEGSLVALFGSIIYPVFRYLMPPRGQGESSPGTILAGTVDELKPNSGKIVRFGNKPVILIKTPHGEIRAFSAICTHLACTVQYRQDLKHIWCACHNGHYDLRGINIAGPPPRPLPPFRVNIKGDKVYISMET